MTASLCIFPFYEDLALFTAHLGSPGFSPLGCKMVVVVVVVVWNIHWQLQGLNLLKLSAYVNKILYKCSLQHLFLFYVTCVDGLDLCCKEGARIWVLKAACENGNVFSQLICFWEVSQLQLQAVFVHVEILCFEVAVESSGSQCNLTRQKIALCKIHDLHFTNDVHSLGVL